MAPKPKHGLCPTCGQHMKLRQPATFNAHALASHTERGRLICAHGEDLGLITSAGLPRCAQCRHSLQSQQTAPTEPSIPQESLWP